MTAIVHSPDSGIRLELGRDHGRPVDFLEIDGSVTSEHSATLEQAIWRHLPDLRPLRADEFGDYVDRTEMRHSDPLALTQLLLIYHLLRKYSHASQLPFAPPVAALSRLESAPPDAHVQSEQDVVDGGGLPSEDAAHPWLPYPDHVILEVGR